MTVQLRTATPQGYTAIPVSIEVDSSKGLPRFDIIGLPNKTVVESRTRIRSAIENSGFNFPKRHLIVNLAPAEIPKVSPCLELAIVLAILAHSKQLSPKKLQNTLFVGEMGLDGQIKPIRGLINLIEYAQKHHFKSIFIPEANIPEARFLASKIDIFPVKNLQQVFQILEEIVHISPLKPFVKNTNTVENAPIVSTQASAKASAIFNVQTSPILDDIVGQYSAKRALVIAIAGHHNLLLSGPPGAGKSMLASVAASLLPSPTSQECLEIVKLHSLSTKIAETANIIKNLGAEPIITRPFRTPHHTISSAAFIGGGSQLSPGEISLATHGILFLDELPEFPRNLLEALRQPLENRTINLKRSKLETTYPANFILLATMNPCPCGYFGSNQHSCTCSASTREHYRRKLSGPLLDRFDMILKLPQISPSVLVKNTTSGTQQHESARAKITHALKAQKSRHIYNCELSPKQLKQELSDPKTKQILEESAKHLNLSARAFFKIIRVARTIADLEQCVKIQTEHIQEALIYRHNI